MITAPVVPAIRSSECAKIPPQQSAAHLISLAYQLRMKPYFPQLADHSETDDPILAERLQHRQEHLIR
jgi:hypothetical protein